MAEAMLRRSALVCRMAEHKVWLRTGRACEGCRTCAGRCAVWIAEAEVALPRHLFGADVVPGDEVTLVMSAPDLLRDAWRGYGLPLLGMLVGAAVGSGLAALMGTASSGAGFTLADLVVLSGAALGTLSMILASKQPRLRVESPPRRA